MAQAIDISEQHLEVAVPCVDKADKGIPGQLNGPRRSKQV